MVASKFIKSSFSAIQNMITTNIIKKTELQYNQRISDRLGCNLFFKREDLQSVRSFKIRGAYNKISNSNSGETFVTVSAGNHAQGVSLTCSSLGIDHHVFLPETTPLQKINRIRYYGKDKLNLHLKGNNFDESLIKANEFCKTNKSIFVHPFDDEDVIIGQSTIAYEIYEDIKPDIIICPIGGGGLISGIGQYSKIINKKCLAMIERNGDM